MYACLLLILSSCVFTDENHFDIEDSLKPYVDKFYAEATARGQKIQHDNLLAYTTGALKHREGASGQSMPGGLPTIRIADDLMALGDTLLIEYVVFHELGHALLYREHQEGFTMMSTKDYLIPDYKYRPHLRKELIDELFR